MEIRLKYDTDDLHTLLAHGFKLTTGPRGEALRLRGAARADAEAAQPKRTIDVPYLDGAMPKVQTWTVEPDPVPTRRRSRWTLALLLASVQPLTGVPRM